MSQFADNSLNINNLLRNAPLNLNKNIISRQKFTSSKKSGESPSLSIDTHYEEINKPNESLSSSSSDVIWVKRQDLEDNYNSKSFFSHKNSNSLRSYNHQGHNSTVNLSSGKKLSDKQQKYLHYAPDPYQGKF